MLDGTNSFSLPITLLEKQNDFTIEFEVKRANGVIKPEDNISLISNHDEENKAGIGIKYFSPPYNAAWLYINGFRAIEQRGFLANIFLKYTILVKDKNMMLFRNGLLLAMTDKVNPSNQPITIGEAGGVRVHSI